VQSQQLQWVSTAHASMQLYHIQHSATRRVSDVVDRPVLPRPFVNTFDGSLPVRKMTDIVQCHVIMDAIGTDFYCFINCRLEATRSGKKRI